MHLHTDQHFFMTCGNYFYTGGGNDDKNPGWTGGLLTRLKERDILVDEFNIVNFEFSKVFNEAIEAKVTAEQQALAAKNKLEQIKFEAEQKVAEAKGKAEAITIESNALRSNPQILELRALEKWNGVLPQVTGGAIPFINLPK